MVHIIPAYLDPARAPGATDNARGVAIVLELARLVS
jgi:Zn-dependent M28 family amino/carboxypeptidase